MTFHRNTDLYRSNLQPANDNGAAPRRSKDVCVADRITARPLLTIIVPTYNRAHCLEMLLEALHLELAGLDGKVAVIIGDNASTDDTPILTQQFTERWVDTTLIRQATNLGPEENFCRCVEQVHSEYFWIIGDDDLPRAGAVVALLKLLAESRPDLVYLSSEWSRTLPARDAHGSLTLPLDVLSMDRLTFARRIHVWTSFISGCIVKRAFAPKDELRRFAGTSLVQLGWVMEALRQGERFLHVGTPTVYATAGNTGGYSVLKVFGQNFPRITREIFNVDQDSHRIAENIVNRTSIAFLPGLVWDFRKARLGHFDPNESAVAAMAPELGRSWIYHIIIMPIERWPEWSARAVLKVSQVIARIVALFDRLRAI